MLLTDDFALAEFAGGFAVRCARVLVRGNASAAKAEMSSVLCFMRIDGAGEQLSADACVGNTAFIVHLC